MFSYSVLEYINEYFLLFSILKAQSIFDDWVIMQTTIQNYSLLKMIFDIGSWLIAFIMVVHFSISHNQLKYH